MYFNLRGGDQIIISNLLLLFLFRGFFINQKFASRIKEDPVQRQRVLRLLFLCLKLTTNTLFWRLASPPNRNYFMDNSSHWEWFSFRRSWPEQSLTIWFPIITLHQQNISFSHYMLPFWHQQWKCPFVWQVAGGWWSVITVTGSKQARPVYSAEHTQESACSCHGQRKTIL